MNKPSISDEELEKILIEYMPKANILLEDLEERNDKSDPHRFSKKYKRNIKRIIKDHGRSPIQNKLATFARYVAGILILIILINSVLIVSVEAYRENFFETITNIYKKFTSIVIDVDEDDIDSEENFIKPPYIPEGFEIINDIQIETTRKTDYINNEDKIISYRQSIITNKEVIIDTESISFEEMEIQNQKIEYYLNKDAYIARWNSRKFIYSVTAEVSFEELVRIIEGIVEK